jgi:hypothetical protein
MKLWQKQSAWKNRVGSSEGGFGLPLPLVINTGWEHTAPPHMTAEELEKRMDELAREFAKTHDEEVKAELEA